MSFIPGIRWTRRHSIAFGMLLILLSGCQPQQITLNSELTIGSRFPAIAGEDLDGMPLSLEEYQDKVVLLDFFGDW